MFEQRKFPSISEQIIRAELARRRAPGKLTAAECGVLAMANKHGEIGWGHGRCGVVMTPEGRTELAALQSLFLDGRIMTARWDERSTVYRITDAGEAAMLDAGMTIPWKVDTSDIPEAGAEWFARARLVEPRWPVDPRAPVVGATYVLHMDPSGHTSELITCDCSVADRCPQSQRGQQPRCQIWKTVRP